MIATDQTHAPRRWLRAVSALLSLVFPGLGQAVQGETRRALIFAATALAWGVAYRASPYGAIALPSALWPVFVTLLLPVGLVLGVWAAADAFWLRPVVRRAGAVKRCLFAIAVAAVPALPGLAVDETWVQYFIPSASMLPNLLVGDHILAVDGYYERAAPARGELAAFRFPRDPATLYIKRIIGLPGDTVQMKDGTLLINGAPVPVERGGIFFGVPPDCGFGAHSTFIETLPGGARDRVVRGCGPPFFEDTDVFTVPPDHYFMLGDNRDGSEDSRDPSSGVGFVPRSDLVARAVFVVFSLGDAPRWWRKLRWRRTARLIE